MQKEIISQYKASLNMLKDIINKCPDNIWDNKDYESSYWRIVYHALFYAHFYLSPSASDFTAWEKHHKDYNELGAAKSGETQVIFKDVYSKNDLIDYLEQIKSNCENLVYKIPLDKESGFYWLPLNKFELHLYNIRHIQHHTGQLIERLHQNGITGIKWKRQG